VEVILKMDLGCRTKKEYYKLMCLGRLQHHTGGSIGEREGVAHTQLGLA